MNPACPSCCVPLMPAAGDGGHACPQCRGSWAPLTLLRRRHARDTVDAAWHAACFGSPGVGDACPGCRRLMAEVQLPDGHPIGLCRGCQTAWLPDGSTDALGRSGPAVPAPAERPQAPPRPATTSVRAPSAEERATRAIRRRIQEGEAIGGGPDQTWKWWAGFLGLPVKMGQMATMRTPWSNWGLCAAVLVIGILLIQGDLASTVADWGFLPAEPLRHAGTTWLTSFFIHAGAGHLFGNLWFLWMTGDNVADRLGPRRYLILVFVAALAGDLAHFLGDPRSGIPCVGASGGIAGVMMAFACLYPRAQIGQAWFFGKFWLRLPAWGWLGLWILAQMWMASEQIAGFSNVSALAHLGGAAAGAALWWWWRPADEGEPG